MKQAKIVREKTMSAAAVTAEAKSKAWSLVRREEYHCGSRMVAYENIGRMIGASGSWVRQFVKGYVDSCPSLPVGLNIIALHDRLCVHFEEAAETERSKDAALKSYLGMVEGAAKAEAHRDEDQTI